MTSCFEDSKEKIALKYLEQLRCDKSSGSILKGLFWKYYLRTRLIYKKKLK